MTTAYSTNLELALPVQGELSGTWGDTVNNGITQYTNIAIAGTLTLTGDGAVTLQNTTGDASASNITATLSGAGTVTAQFALVKVTGTLTTTKVVTFGSAGSAPYSKTYTVVNAATGGSVSFTAYGGTGVTIAVGESAYVYYDGTNIVKVATSTAGTGTVTAVSVASTNGFAGTSSGGATPALTLSTSITGVLKGNGTAISAATAGTDYVAPGGALGTPASGTVTNLTGTASININGTVGATTATTGAFTTLTTSSTAQILSLGVGTAASGTTGEIRATNNVTAYYSSDIKFKENVRDIPDALNTVNAIGGKLFDWTDEYIESKGGADGYFVQKADFGVVAQDVQKVFPIAVRTREDGSLAVDYEKLGALAFAALVELTKRVEALEAK